MVFPGQDMISHLGKGQGVYQEDSVFGSFVDSQFELLEGTGQGRQRGWVQKVGKDSNVRGANSEVMVLARGSRRKFVYSNSMTRIFVLKK